MTTRLSIIITCYNLGPYLEEALMSCPRGELFETLVIDDGSTSIETINAIADLTIKYPEVKFIRQENAGVEAARNNGIALSRGRFVLPLDADNYLIDDFEKRFAEEILPLMEAKDIDVYYTDRYVIGSDERISSEPFDPVKLISSNFIDTCSVIRKETFDKTNGFPKISKIKGNEDWLLWLEFVQIGAKFHYDPTPIFHYRILEGSQIRSINHFGKDYLNHLCAVKPMQLAALNKLEHVSAEAQNKLISTIETNISFRSILIESYGKAAWSYLAAHQKQLETPLAGRVFNLMKWTFIRIRFDLHRRRARK